VKLSHAFYRELAILRLAAYLPLWVLFQPRSQQVADQNIVIDNKNAVRDVSPLSPWKAAAGPRCGSTDGD
jgi:hypothetical protein